VSDDFGEDVSEVEKKGNTAGCNRVIRVEAMPGKIEVTTTMDTPARAV
jgi:hypothetical protein